MSLKKLLGIISVVVVVMFTLMLATSYAWYSFDNASTTFDTTTSDKEILVTFQRGEYINTSIAVPISNNFIDKYSEKSNFTVKMSDNSENESMLVQVSLVDVSIAPELKSSQFKIDLYHQGRSVTSQSGSDINSDIFTLGSVTLEDDVDNQFELRVYILDDGTDQTLMMNKMFTAKVKIDVVSKVNINEHDFSNPDIYISNINIDGNASDHIPVDGYYKMEATCEKNSELTWDAYSKTITYTNTKINDKCSLTFTKDVSTKLLNSVEVGSYVKYTGNNGCSGKACDGQNANYKNDKDMGWCGDNNYKYTSNGWRVAYVKDGSAYLVSGGALECMSIENINDASLHLVNLNKIALKYCNKEFSYDGVCDNNNVWSINEKDFKMITGNDLNNSSCYDKKSDSSCGYRNNLINNGGYYWFSSILANGSVFDWQPNIMGIGSSYSNSIRGIRPVLKLDSTVKVVSGVGTYDDPYIISNH